MTKSNADMEIDRASSTARPRSAGASRRFVAARFQDRRIDHVVSPASTGQGCAEQWMGKLGLVQ